MTFLHRKNYLLTILTGHFLVGRCINPTLCHIRQQKMGEIIPFLRLRQTFGAEDKNLNISSLREKKKMI